MLPHLRVLQLEAAARPVWTAADLASLGLAAAHPSCEVCQAAVNECVSWLLIKIKIVCLSEGPKCNPTQLGCMADRCASRCIDYYRARKHLQMMPISPSRPRWQSVVKRQTMNTSLGSDAWCVRQVHVDASGCKTFQPILLVECLKETGLLPRLRALRFACQHWVGPVRQEQA